MGCNPKGAYMTDLIQKAIQQYDIQIISTNQINEDGDVFLSLTLDDKKMIQVFFVMFLVILIAENIEMNRSNRWFNNTLLKLCKIYIPGIQKNGFFIKMNERVLAGNLWEPMEVDYGQA